MKIRKAFESTITKISVECYKLRHLRNSNWADITIDEGNQCGRLQIVSSYGNYQYFWNGCGKDFKSFLIEINLEYLADKLGADDWFDYAETMAHFRHEILESRKYGSLGKETAKLLWEEIKALNPLRNPLDEKDFIMFMERQQNLMNFFNGMPELVFTVRPQFNRFWDECWLLLMDKFNAEKIKQS